MIRVGHIDAELGFAPQNGIGDVGRRVVQNLDSIVRKLGGVLLNHVREELDAGRWYARNRNIAAQRLAGLADFDERRRQFGQQATRLRQEVSSKRGERDGARGP